MEYLFQSILLHFVCGKEFYSQEKHLPTAIIFGKILGNTCWNMAEMSLGFP